MDSPALNRTGLSLRRLALCSVSEIMQRTGSLVALRTLSSALTIQIKMRQSILKQYLNLLMEFHKVKHGKITQYVSLLFGSLFFLFILPSIFFIIAQFISKYVKLNYVGPYKYFIIVTALFIGLSILVWTTICQLKIGHGTPAPNAPTQKLVIVGPYKYTRNPIELGALFYYFGFGWLFGSTLHGIISLVLGFIIGSSYHKFIEEKELLLRFGDEYKKYRDNTPFLIPKINS